MSDIITPYLYVVGAGPGDPDLITVKGSRIISMANVILYDNLINKELLKYAKADCEIIYVGKKPYGEYTPQEDIHALIKEKALQKGIVVRLKGGDPYIFGRGYEEILFAREANIPAEYVPGVTSMQTAGLNNIPLTHRHICESFWVVTGTKKDGSLSNDLHLAIESKATVIIYMGMKKLQQIADAYISAGFAQMPAAIIQHGSLPKQKMARGEVQHLATMAAENGLTHPSIIIIGKVVDL